MAENNDGPPEEQPQPQDVIGMIFAEVNILLDQRDARLLARLDQRDAKAATDLADIRRGLSQELATAVGDIRVQLESATAGLPRLSPGGQSAMREDPPSQDVALPPMPAPNIGAGIAALLMDFVNNPMKLAETAVSFAGAWNQVKGAAKGPDDFAMARLIAQRTPAAIILNAPDPTQGTLPQLLSNMIQQGVRIGVSARGAPAAPGGGTSPLAPSGPGALPGALPAPSAPPSPTPSQPSAPVSVPVLLGQMLERLDDDGIDAMLAHLSQVSYRRKAAA